MDNVQPPQSQETKDFLEKECGLKPYAPTREPNYANPDKMECKFVLIALTCFLIDHMFSFVILTASIAGR